VLLFSTDILSSQILLKNLKIKIYKTLIMLVVLYSCETWFLALREEFRLRIFDTGSCGQYLDPRRVENWEWRRLQNEEFYSLYYSSYILRVITYRRLRWTGHVGRMEEDKSAFKILTSKPTGKRLLGRPRLRWEDNIQIDLKEIGISSRIGLIQPRIGAIGKLPL
jgi:hypothetical protein